MIPYKQLSLADIFQDRQNKFNNDKPAFLSCMIIRKLIITRFLSFNIVVQYNSDTMDF